jgi:hypothetical protein
LVTIYLNFGGTKIKISLSVLVPRTLKILEILCGMTQMTKLALVALALKH